MKKQRLMLVTFGNHRGQPFPRQLLEAVSVSRITKRIMLRYFWQGIVLPLFVFLENCEIKKKVLQKFVKPWEMKKLPWGCEKDSEIVTVVHGETVRLERYKYTLLFCDSSTLFFINLFFTKTRNLSWNMFFDTIELL